MQTPSQHRQGPASLLPLIVAGLAGCSIAQNPSGAANQTSVSSGSGIQNDPNSIPTVASPQPRTTQLTAQLNAYRQQLYGMPTPVAFSDVLYTSALRHVMYENSINSSGFNANSVASAPVVGAGVLADPNAVNTAAETAYQQALSQGESQAQATQAGSAAAAAAELAGGGGSAASIAAAAVLAAGGTPTAAAAAGAAAAAQAEAGGSSGGNAAEGTTITTFNHLVDIDAEPVVPAAGQPFPALFTDTNLFNRVLFIVGSLGLTQGNGASGSAAFENFIFNGNVWRPDGTLSEFRGFNLDTDRSTNPATYDFTPVDCAWYSHDGRASLERSSVQYFGYAATSDSSLWTPPFPILNGRMIGLINILAAGPLTNQFGFWPCNGAVVARYGTDFDLQGPNQFAGTPISITLPVAEPLLADIGVVDCELHRSDGIEPSVPDTWRYFQCYSDVDGLNVPYNGQTPGDFPPGTGLYEASGLPAPLFSKVNVESITVLGYNGDPPDTWETNFAIDPSVATFGQIKPGDTLEVFVAAGTAAGSYDFTVDSTDINTHSIDVGIPSPAWNQASWAGNLENVTVSLISHTFAGVSTLVDSHLIDGEFMIVPVAPLETNAQYTVNLQLQTATYNSGALQFTFTTDDR